MIYQVTYASEDEVWIFDEDLRADSLEEAKELAEENLRDLEPWYTWIMRIGSADG